MVNETSTKGPAWESLCESCGGSCPEFRQMPDGQVEIRDTAQHDKAIRLKPAELRKLLLRTLVVG